MAAGDVYRYGNGVEYVETDGGPNFWTSCFRCGATACSTPDIPMRNVRCGRCLAEQHELLPGQRMYDKIVDWQAEYRRAHEAPRG